MKTPFPGISLSATARVMTFVFFGLTANLNAAPQTETELPAKKAPNRAKPAAHAGEKQAASQAETKRTAVEEKLAAAAPLERVGTNQRTPGQTVVVGTIANDSAEAGLLREAYGILSVADHDYKGHRAKAMKEIEAAAKYLGVSLRGDGKVREAQGTSDTQLRAAAALLDQASGGLQGRGLQHIKLAYAQLNVALEIR